MSMEEESAPEWLAEEVYQWAQNYEKQAYDSLLIQIDEAFEEARTAVTAGQSEQIIYSRLGRVCRLLTRQADYFAKPRLSDLFKEKP